MVFSSGGTERTYSAIWSSSSWILAAFWTFFGLGFLTVGILGGRRSSFRINESVISGLKGWHEEWLTYPGEPI
jgi:hypothetical protein